MRALFAKLFSLTQRKKIARQRFRKLLAGAEQLEVRSLLATTGIVVNGDSSEINGGPLITFNYSGGTGGTFSMVGSSMMPPYVMPSPGMPPTPSRNGVWEFVGQGDVIVITWSNV